MNNTNPYIPNGSTPIKNEILFDIIAKGLLSYTEIRIVMYIIYKSWRFVNLVNHRRQDWTNPLTIMQISKDIEMSYAETCRTLNTMTKSHILLKDGNKYQFNEHYEDYDKKSYMTKSHTTMTNNHTSMTKSHSPPSTNTDEKSAGSSLNKLLNKLTKENNIYRTKIIFNDQSFKFENIPEEKINKWKEAFPNCNVDLELKKMEVWLVANPKKRYKNYEKFIVNWLSRAKGGKDGKYISVNSIERKGGEANAGEW